MKKRVGAAAIIVALALLSLTTACAPVDHTYDPNGRCLHFQLSVKAEPHPGSTSADPSWDLLYKNTSPVGCVFGGVPKVKLEGAHGSAGIVKLAFSQDVAVQLAYGDVGYTNIVLIPPAAGCTKVPVRSIALTAPHVAGGGYVIPAPKGFSGCAGVVIAQVGQTTAKRAQ